MITSVGEDVTISEALFAAMNAHKDQKYGERPYITHVVEVADRLVRDFDEHVTHDAFVSAILHDIVEDTWWTLDDVEFSFGEDIAEIVGLLTKDESLSYEENISRIANSGNLNAIMVKIADNNTNLSNNPKPKNKIKYGNGLDTLLDAFLKNK